MDLRVSHFHVAKAKAVQEYGYFEDKNFPIRQKMEDNYIAEDQFPEEGQALFCILDGHGGESVSEFCATALPNIFSGLYSPKKNNNILGLFEDTFSKADEQLKLVGASQTGSTCCMCFIQELEGRKMCHVANLGDSRAILALNNNTARRVTTDHKVTTISQQERIKKEGGVILKGRVAGQLAITRALGDLQLKTEGVSNKPQVESFQIAKNMTHLIIASDGLWDVCEDDKAVELTKEMNTAEMAKTLVQFALKNGSRDNVSVLAIKF